MSHERNTDAARARESAPIGYILCGGESSRFGTDKARYPIGALPMWQHVAEAIAPSVAEVVLVVRETWADTGLRQITDRNPERGPLVGIEAAITDAKARQRDALVVACDLLGIGPAWPGELVCAIGAAHAAAFHDGRWQSVFSLWRPESLDAVRAAIAADERAVWKILDRIGTRVAVPTGWGAMVVANTRDAADAFVRRTSPTRPVDVVSAHGEERPDLVAVEEPLEIRLETFAFGKRQTRPVSITMRTPGADHELAVGFLYGEGIIARGADVAAVMHCDDGANPNVVNVRLSDDVAVDFARLQRNFYTTSSCGVCGKTSLEALEVIASPVETLELAPAVVSRLPELLRERQPVFDQTGAIHGAGLFTPAGEPVLVREDVGRHNALDKVVGARVLAGHDLGGHVVVLSGRASFELLQKALVARCGAVVAVGAPSSLAVDLARTNGIALYGFVRGERFNRYA